MKFLSFRSVVDIRDFSREQLEAIMDYALEFEPIGKGLKTSDMLSGKILATLWYEPSTRTRMSFESAMMRLGGKVLSTPGMLQVSAAWKGESLEDTLRTVQNYSDVIAFRHHQSGASRIAEAYTDIPVINGGDGGNQHPTQGMLDLLTLRRERGNIDGLKITFVGDLSSHCRSVNSLAWALTKYKTEIRLVSPWETKMNPEIMKKLRDNGSIVYETEDMREGIEGTDVLYMIRVQKERFKDPVILAKLEKNIDKYHLNRRMLEKAGGDTITVMHPMPRINEVSYDVDDYPGTCYFRESFNGLLIRMALLSIVLGKGPDK